MILDCFWMAIWSLSCSVGIYLITVILSAFRFFKEINHSASLLAGRTINNSTLWKKSHFPDCCLAQCKKLDSKRDFQSTKGDGHLVPSDTDSTVQFSKMPYYTGKETVFDNSHRDHMDYILATHSLWRRVHDRVGEQLSKGHNLHIYWWLCMSHG